MTIRPLRSFMIALGFTVSGHAALAAQIVDAVGAKINLAERPGRIVTLAPSLGELAADLAGTQIERIVGVSEFTDYPPALKKVTSVGPYHRINIEKVLSLKPELVLATMDGNLKDQIDHLRELGAPVVVVSTENFSQVGESMRLVGRAMGETKAGESMASQFETGLSRIRERASERRRKGVAKRRVLIQIGDEPLIVAGRKAFLNEAILAIGADNVYGNLEGRYPRPAVEDAVVRDPDMILVLALSGEAAVFSAMATKWARFEKMRAVRTKAVQVLKADALLRPSLRLLEGLSILERTVYAPI